MALKTFNISKNVYDKYSKICKSNGISMSKQIEIFMRAQIEDEPEAKKEYLDKLEKIRKGKFIKVSDIDKEFGLE